MLRIGAGVHAEMVAHCWAGLPLEACGLLAGTGDDVSRCYPTANVAASALVYTVDPIGFLHADWFHLIFNMYSFYAFGKLLEWSYGPLPLLAIYFASVAGGSLAPVTCAIACS